MSGALHGKTALVTGSSRGIGQLVAIALAREGCKLVICHGRTAAACAATVAGIEAAGAKALALGADLADPQAVEGLADQVLAAGGVDILYNNAAVMCPWRDQLAGQAQADWTATFQINVFALVRLCTRLVPGMQAKGWGRVVNVTSGIDKTWQLSAYGASKWAVDKWTDDLSASVRAGGVIVSRMDPGWLRTDLGGPNADYEPGTVLPGALVPVLLPDEAAGAQFFRAQDFRQDKAAGGGR